MPFFLGASKYFDGFIWQRFNDKIATSVLPSTKRHNKRRCMHMASHVSRALWNL